MTRYKVGQVVRDDLTRKISVIIGISYKDGTNRDKDFNCSHCLGLWLNNDYLGGGRHPWEVSSAILYRG